MSLNFIPTCYKQNYPPGILTWGIFCYLLYIIPASHIVLSGNYQGAVFILSSGKKEIFITMSTTASQEWLVSQLSDLATSFEGTIQ